ncbi:hypothetical protein EI94DRAFT_914818 [Lactarius quietus]|nr:hypothetical protein EI94DRAFT_914818 [Lactarius quietus]
MPITTLPMHRDPLHFLLEYITEAAPPSCDIVLVHDDDLARLDGNCEGITLDDLQSGVMLNHIRSLRPTVHNARIDLSSARNGTSANADSACVATLSSVFEERSSTLERRYPENVFGTSTFPPRAAAHPNSPPGTRVAGPAAENMRLRVFAERHEQLPRMRGGGWSCRSRGSSRNSSHVFLRSRGLRWLPDQVVLTPQCPVVGQSPPSRWA